MNLHLPAFKSESSNPQVVASLAAIALSALEMFTSYCVWRSSLALTAPRSLQSKQHLATHFLNLNLYFKVPESPLVFVCMINMIEHKQTFTCIPTALERQQGTFDCRDTL